MANTHPKRQQRLQEKLSGKRFQVVVGFAVVAALAVTIAVLIWNGAFNRPNYSAIRQIMLRMISQIQNMPGMDILRASSRYFLSNTAVIFASLAILGAIISKVFDKMWEYSKYFRKSWLDFIQYWGISFVALLVLAYAFGLLAERLFHITLSP